MISQYEAIKSQNCTKIQTIDIFDLRKGVLPNIFLSLFFLEKRGGKKECLIHFFTSCQPPSSLNKSRPGRPVEARKMTLPNIFLLGWGSQNNSYYCFLKN